MFNIIILYFIISTSLLIKLSYQLPTLPIKYIIQLKSNAEFCSFLPPHRGDDVGATENDGIPFCTNSNLGNPIFPSGFIQSSHFKKTINYVQVTGRINRDKYELKITDGGGQYDQLDVEPTLCNNYKYFVNLIEPDSNQFCIRCCKNKSDCNIGISTKGCQRIVPGDYS